MEHTYITSTHARRMNIYWSYCHLGTVNARNSGKQQKLNLEFAEINDDAVAYTRMIS